MRALNTKSTVPLVTCVLAVAALSWAVENPNVGNPNIGNPVQRSNTPSQSGQGQRFITQPGSNPYGNVGNDVVSGNVGGGRHFRGVVPYGSTFYSGAYANTPGSRSVSNFVRRSQSPIVNDRNPGQTSSYYDPSRTVTTLHRPNGTSGLTRPQTTPQGRSNQFVIPNQAFLMPLPPVQRPLSSNNMDLEKILARQEQLREERDAQKTTEDEEPERRNFFDVNLLQKPVQEIEKDNAEDQADEDANIKITPERKLHMELQQEKNKAANEQESLPDDETGEPEDGKPDILSTDSDLLPEMDPGMLGSAEGRNVIGEHKTFDDLARHKFAAYMDIADTFVQEKKFYKAADTYSLAMIWQPNDARAYLGKSFALMAAGEYMSSAFFLSQAFELDPAVAQTKFDLAEYIGDRDTYENRELEIRTWQERSNSGELAFLLAYMSYQDHKSVRAVKAIKMAKEKMPDHPAVQLLDSMINPEPAAQ